MLKVENGRKVIRGESVTREKKQKKERLFQVDLKYPRLLIYENI